MTASVTSNPLNALLAANSPAGRGSLVQANQANAVQARNIISQNAAQRAEDTQLETRSLAVRAAPGASLATQFDFDVGADGQQVVRGVTITTQQPGQAQEQPNLPDPRAGGLNNSTALTDNRPRNFADIQTPRTNLNPVQELQIFAAEQGANPAPAISEPVANASPLSFAEPILAGDNTLATQGFAASDDAAVGVDESNQPSSTAEQAQAARRQLQATTQYQLQNDLVFTTNPVFDAAA